MAPRRVVAMSEIFCDYVYILKRTSHVHIYIQTLRFRTIKEIYALNAQLRAPFNAPGVALHRRNPRWPGYFLHNQQLGAAWLSGDWHFYR